MAKSAKWLIFLLFFGCNTKSKSDELISPDPAVLQFIGFYEYQSAKKEPNQYILIDTLHGRMYGIFYRTEQKRGKGKLYYANSLSQFNIRDQSIQFILSGRKLFSAQPVKPGERRRELPRSMTLTDNNSTQFRGRIVRDQLQLQCVSSYDPCSSQTMIFRKIPLLD